ncbi:hypothetical protein SBY92_000909 [Candida maltosa Xu316]
MKDLNLMPQNWTIVEKEQHRRLVQFEFTAENNLQYISFQGIDPEKYENTKPTVSCIYWKDKGKYIVTSVDIILLLEYLVQQTFDVEEKNRIRRNLQSLKPTTISRTSLADREFFNLIMSMENPRPRNIEKDLKVFNWCDLGKAVGKVMSKYYVVPSEATRPWSIATTTSSPPVNLPPHIQQQLQHSIHSPQVVNPIMIPQHEVSPHPAGVQSAALPMYFPRQGSLPNMASAMDLSSPPIQHPGIQHVPTAPPAPPAPPHHHQPSPIPPPYYQPQSQSPPQYPQFQQPYFQKQDAFVPYGKLQLAPYPPPPPPPQPSSAGALPPQHSYPTAQHYQQQQPPPVYQYPQPHPQTTQPSYFFYPMHTRSQSLTYPTPSRDRTSVSSSPPDSSNQNSDFSNTNTPPLKITNNSSPISMNNNNNVNGNSKKKLKNNGGLYFTTFKNHNTCNNESNNNKANSASPNDDSPGSDNSSNEARTDSGGSNFSLGKQNSTMSASTSSFNNIKDNNNNNISIIPPGTKVQREEGDDDGDEDEDVSMEEEETTEFKSKLPSISLLLQPDDTFKEVKLPPLGERSKDKLPSIRKVEKWQDH